MIDIQGENILVQDFLGEQAQLLTDVEIICGGLHNIMDHNKSYSFGLMDQLTELYTKIYEKDKIILSLPDAVVGKQEIVQGMRKILVDIKQMQDVLHNMKDEKYYE
ncbi:MAG: hypothetical protein GY828_00190 [Candidatus Gracilibacteria bacterium]|nr:hypothetical protein [Candidatus Gracilibacteria bacterium]